MHVGGLAVANTVNTLYLLLIDSTCDMALCLTGTSPFIVATGMGFTTESDIGRIMRHARRDTFLTNACRIEGSGAVVAPSLRTPISGRFAVGPCSARSVRVPRRLFFTRPGAGAVAPIVLAVATAVPSSSSTGNKVVNTSSAGAFHRSGRGILFTIGTSCPAFISNINQMAMSVFEVTNRSLWRGARDVVVEVLLYNFFFLSFMNRTST